jgi:drug/metabolite transporter (DMT)-like permease
MQNRRKNLIAYLGLLFTSIIWGFAFVPQKTAMLHTGAHSFNAARFLLAASFAFSVVFFTGRKIAIATLRRGTNLGIFLFLGYATQQIGMQYTTATNGGFITGLYLLLVPIQVTLLRKDKLSIYLWLGALMALIGLTLLCLTSGIKINQGDIWILACAILFTQHIILIDKYVDQSDFLSLAAVQFLLAGLMFLSLALLFEGEKISGLSFAWKEILYAGLLSAGIAIIIQMYSQRYVPASQAALMCSLESVFAALAGWLLLGETLTQLQFLGCILMFGGTIIACVKSDEKKHITGVTSHNTGSGPG